MTSGVPWQVKGVRREAIETAHEAARRSGMSVAEWLDNVIAQSARDAGIEPAGPGQPDRSNPAISDPSDPQEWRRRYSDHDERRAWAEEPEGADVKSRLRTLSRRVSELAAGAAEARDNPFPASPIDEALAEIEARQRALDDEAPADRMEPAGAPTQRLPDLDYQLRDLNTRMDTMRDSMRASMQPCRIDSAIETLRDDLAEIGVMLKDATPRHAIEALEDEVRSLGARIDDKRHAGVKREAIASLEQRLAEVRDALHALTPAEKLAELGEIVNRLSEKIDRLPPTGQDPESLKQLEGAIVALRGVASHAASDDAIAALFQEVRGLSAKVDQVAGSGAFSSIEQQIASLAEFLESRGVPPGAEMRHLETVVAGLSDKVERLQVQGGTGADTRELEMAVAGLSDRIERLQVHGGSGADTRELEAAVAGLSARLERLLPAPSDTDRRDLEAVMGSLADKIENLHAIRPDHSALGHLEDRIVKLADRLEASDDRSHLQAIERGLTDLLTNFEHQRAQGAHREEIETAEANALKRDVQRTQDALETVHGALGQVVDRLATIESSLRGAQLPRGAYDPEPEPVAVPTAEEPFAAARMPLATPDELLEDLLPPAVAQPVPALQLEPVAQPLPPPAAKPVPPAAASPGPAAIVNPAPAVERKPIDPNLPPDHPLEPGALRSRSGGTPADRIAASEAAIENVRPPVIPDPGGKSNFIAAARRAAQAAVVEAPPAKDKRPAEAAGESIAGKIGGKIRKLMVGAGVVLFVLGSLHFVATRIWFAGTPGGESTAHIPIEDRQPTATSDGGEPPVQRTAPDRQSALLPPENPFPVSPLVTAIGTPSSLPALDHEATGSIRQPAPQAANPPAAESAPAAASPLELSPAPPAAAGRLPSGIGSSALRTAALNGDPAAEFEIATRFAEGRGVPQNLTEAAAWYERAAAKGLALAQFRLGGLYEKGTGVRKDAETARRLYLAAADAGNARAMHNLAVLYAEGAKGKPDYQTAARWFRKAADHGVVDSQYNLAILYARGIGVEINLTEAFMWFALASRDGDPEAARKRDDVAGRLDQPSLTAAMAAAQAWQPQTQPEAAVQVAAPPGGWDGPPPTTAKRRLGPKAEAAPSRH